jgi:hypothetical protein
MTYRWDSDIPFLYAWFQPISAQNEELRLPNSKNLPNLEYPMKNGKDNFFSIFPSIYVFYYDADLETNIRFVSRKGFLL